MKFNGVRKSAGWDVAARRSNVLGNQNGVADVSGYVSMLASTKSALASQSKVDLSQRTPYRFGLWYSVQ